MMQIKFNFNNFSRVSATAWQRASGIRRRRWRLWLAYLITTSVRYVPYAPYVACVALAGNPSWVSDRCHAAVQCAERFTTQPPPPPRHDPRRPWLTSCRHVVDTAWSLRLTVTTPLSLFIWIDEGTIFEMRLFVIRGGVKQSKAKWGYITVCSKAHSEA